MTQIRKYAYVTVFQDGSAGVLDAQVQSRYQLSKSVFYTLFVNLQIARENVRMCLFIPSSAVLCVHITLRFKQERFYANLLSCASWSMWKLAMNALAK